MTQLSRFFTLEELTRSQTAERRNINNDPPADVLEILKRTAEHMDGVRELLGHPIHVSSGYRSPALNRRVGGAASSQHVLGEAVDFVCPGFGSPLEVCRAIAASDLAFDQLIHEFTWVHISFRDGRMRRQTLTLRRGQRGYLPGIQP